MYVSVETLLSVLSVCLGCFSIGYARLKSQAIAWLLSLVAERKNNRPASLRKMRRSSLNFSERTTQTDGSVFLYPDCNKNGHIMQSIFAKSPLTVTGRGAFLIHGL